VSRGAVSGVSDLSRLYQEQILAHHRAPHNAGQLPEPTHSAQAHNPLCGDRVRLTLRVGALPESGALAVLEARCDSQGCALCRASGSLLTDLIIGRVLPQVTAWLERFLELAGSAQLPEQSEDALLLSTVAPLLEVRSFPSRRRCVTLGWEALRAALQEPQEGRRPPE
jgi:nitrogen fixation NifU-like protein